MEQPTAPKGLIEAFGRGVESGEMERTANLFHSEAIYHDTVYGVCHGRAQIARMLPLWYRLARDFTWRFFDILHSGDVAYAKSYFAYTSTHASSLGRRVETLAMSRFVFKEGLIALYEEAANPATGLFQMGVPEASVLKNLRLRAQLDQVELGQVRERLGIPQPLSGGS